MAETLLTRAHAKREAFDAAAIEAIAKAQGEISARGILAAMGEPADSLPLLQRRLRALRDSGAVLSRLQPATDTTPAVRFYRMAKPTGQWSEVPQARREAVASILRMDADILEGDPSSVGDQFKPADRERTRLFIADLRAAADFLEGG